MQYLAFVAGGIAFHLRARCSSFGRHQQPESSELSLHY